MSMWISEIEEPSLGYNDQDGELSIKRIDSTVDLHDMSPVCQFFAALDVILEDIDSLIALPTPNENALKTILNEIVPHFVDIKQIFIDGKLKEINVRSLKEESKRIVKDLLLNGIYPVIPDLYRSPNLNLPTGPRKLKYYSVNLEMIDPLYIEETEKIKEFLLSSFFTERGSLMLQPTGWILNHKLKECVTIRTFSTFTEQIIIVVDEKDLNVVGLDIYV